jgi:hypothetical protein
MKNDSRNRELTEKLPDANVTAEELEAQQIVELPEREAITIVNTNVALPVGVSAGAGLLTGS